MTGYMRKFSVSVALLMFCSAWVRAVPLEVVAINYPPFTQESQADGDHGTAFGMLAQALADSQVTLKPQFYSAARANKLIHSGQWCASFYPPKQASSNYVHVPLSSQPVELGLYRKRQAEPFSWQDLSDLAGSRIAFLRGFSRDGLGLKFNQAGITLFNVETIRQGLQLLLKQRVDYAFADNISGPMLFSELGVDAKDYQFSSTLLDSTPVGIWLNLGCDEAAKARRDLNVKGY
ncbi:MULTISPECIES: amino acid ABC transporter substrate-binding protein [Shewanella]|uniref:Amino acid ABC transporter substrate-binding protein n=1 Tax=Shewanella marisflavi TaxID=260364 RepID=A0ABX5WJE3_9GAMM|nr:MULTISPECIES: amino acid ABC transporter substrate-binding protein [Shewanella]QDF74666.1 amino acid ABC transporter substrate-binding protein [Shewanella marisflavi]